MMPTQQLADFENRLHALRSCWSLTKQDLETAPLCPHCGYRPIEEPTNATASRVLDDIDHQLDRLVEEWTRTVLGNLEDPTVTGNIELLTDSKGKAALNAVSHRSHPPRQHRNRLCEGATGGSVGSAEGNAQ